MFGRFFEHIPAVEHETYRQLYEEDLGRLAAARAVQEAAVSARAEDRMALLFLEHAVDGIYVSPETSQQMSEPPQAESY